MQMDEKMDGILAYMFLMLDKARTAKQSISRRKFVALGRSLEFFPGVEEWFERINQYGKDNKVKIEHYIISSGLVEVISGSKISRYFKKIYACEFLYDVDKVAVWPKNVVNYTTKTQFLYRINKGVLDISNDKDLNKYTPEDERPVPFRNMIYFGDGPTDVPCMKLVKVNGGHSIAVYPTPQQTKKAKGAKEQVDGLLRDGRVNFTAPADYSEGSELDKIVKTLIRKIAETDILCRLNYEQREALIKIECEENMLPQPIVAQIEN